MRFLYFISLLSFFVYIHEAESQVAQWGEFGEWSSCKFSAQDKMKVERRIQLCQLHGINVSPLECSGPPLGESRACEDPSKAGIAFGDKASASEFPSQAFIELNNGDNQCGGTLIQGQWILTAAHCFDNGQAPTRISLGSINKFAPLGQNFTANRICCHKDYNSANLEHDICLVEMKFRPFPSPSISTMKMTKDTSVYKSGLTCRVAGWGYDEFRDLPDELLKANVSVVSKDICASSYKSAGNILPKTTICAGHLQGGADTCGGDSGGPLICEHDGVWSLSGITSQGHYECGIKGFPGVYTRVADYVPWVEETMKNPCQKYEWSEWKKECSVTCGNGVETRIRDCLDEDKNIVGDINCLGIPQEFNACNQPKCEDDDFQWGEWVKVCSVTCGEGIEAMFRPCFDKNGIPTEDSNCDGESSSSGTCNPGSCQEEEKFHWGEWISACSVTCGEGIEAKFRPCLDAEDNQADTDNCDGESQSTGKCNPKSCEVYHWGDWTRACSVTCGEGVEEMVRECLDEENNPTDEKNCDGNAKSVGKCNPQECPKFHWGEWVMACSVTCGEGIEARLRPCLDENDIQVEETNCDGDAEFVGTCNPKSCKEYRWSDWKGTCSVTCGEGEEFRLRTCLDEEDNAVELEYCDGEFSMIGKCNRPACVFHWGQWKKVCSVTCGDGMSDMERVCLDDNDNEVVAGNCEGSAKGQEKCSLAPCQDKKKIEDNFCFLSEATYDTLDQFKDSFEKFKKDLQNNMRFIPEYKSSDINSEFRSVSGKVEGVAIINVQVELDSADDRERSSSLISVYIRALGNNNGFNTPNECGAAVDPCSSKPCQNDGVCGAIPGSVTDYQCQCKFRFTGKNCETEITPCTSEPCQNEGVCTRLSTTRYRCRCKGGFVGKNCEQEKINPCNSQPCQNEGSCIRQSNTRYRCRCKKGYSGKDCETASNPCLLNPCQNDGDCTRLSSTRYQCGCKAGYTGKNCETEIVLDPCMSKPCQNEGLCQPLTTSTYRCQCRQGFTGSNCQTEIKSTVEDFCLEVSSRRGLASQFFPKVFSSFRDDLSTRLRSYSAYRAVFFEGSGSGNKLDVTIKIQAEVGNGMTTGAVEGDLKRYVEAASLKSGIGGAPTSCGDDSDTKIVEIVEGEKYCTQISTPDIAGSDAKLQNMRSDLQSSLKTFPGFQRVDFETTFEIGGSTKMTVTVSTTNTARDSNWEEYLLYFVQRSAQSSGLTDIPTTCKAETQTPKNPCLPNPCQNEGTCSQQGTNYNCQCRAQYSGVNCETRQIVEQNPDEYCYEVKSTTPNARAMFNTFGSQLQSQLTTFNGFRGVGLSASARRFPGGEEIVIIVRIQAVASGRTTVANINVSLWQFVETASRNAGLNSSVNNCSST